jgi:hypothetical protein
MYSSDRSQLIAHVSYPDSPRYKSLSLMLLPGNDQVQCALA